MCLGVESEDIVWSCVIKEKSSDEVNVSFSAEKGMFLSASGMQVSFGQNLDPVEGFFWLLEGYRVEIMKAAFQYLVSSVEIESS